MYLRCTWPGSQRRRPAPQRAVADALARPGYTPGTCAVNCRAETSPGVRKLKPGHRPPAAPPSPAPPRRQARNELKPPAAFRITARRTKLWRPRPGAVGHLDPDDAVPGDDRDRDRLPGSSRAAMPDTVTEDLAHQQDSHVSARVPRAEYLEDERAGGPRPLRPPARQASRCPGPPPWPSPHPPFPARTSPGEVSGPPGGHTRMHARLRALRQARAIRPRARPWPSVETPTVRTDRRNYARRPS